MAQEEKGKHPSGLTWERWNWPFKTADERKLVAKYFKKTAKQETKNMKEKVYESEPALL
ncbi:MAG: hypothetical protein ACO24H_05180 [Polynucleobacter sp.]